MKTVIEMAREAGLMPTVLNHWPFELERFASLVRADEREACAKVADAWSKRDDDAGAFIGRAIRARSNT